MSTSPANVVKLEVPHFDSRVVLRNISAGVVTEKEYQKHLKSLKDLTEEAEEFIVTVGEDEATTGDDETAEADITDDESTDS